MVLSHFSVRPCAANRSDQEAATVDRQSLAGHQCLSHQVEIALGNLLRVGDMPDRQALSFRSLERLPRLIGHLTPQRCIDDAWGDDVDAYRRQLYRQGRTQRRET